ncbi:MAG: hypothetical protein JXA44_00915 [Methanospirillaceae archaeon]|nr:hypothetical protein [Methanospirillaceae archaeon]
MTLTQEQQRSLIHDVSSLDSHGHGDMEDKENFLRYFYPVPAHIRGFDPEVVIILGKRGVGKSALYEAVTTHRLISVISRFSPQQRIQQASLSKTSWCKGYNPQKRFPDPQVIFKIFEKDWNGRIIEQIFWHCYLLRELSDNLPEVDKNSLELIISGENYEPLKIIEAFIAAGEFPYYALDRLDQSLEKEGRFIYIAYDALDSLGIEQWELHRRLISGLISFWAKQSRRWSNIRAKIFIRTDLYERYLQIGEPDVIKLAANRVEITWLPHHLYAMLIKRIANINPSSLAYCQDAGIHFKKDNVLGHIPQISSLDDADLFITRFIGQYMGSDNRKGKTNTWILNHLQDGKKNANPRPLIRLIGKSATAQKDSTLPSPPHLISPVTIRRELDQISVEEIMSAQSEWPWINDLKQKLEGKQIPMEEKDLEQIITKLFRTEWKEGSKNRPPSDNPSAFIEYLDKLGLIKERPDKRIDVTDLYRAGLGLKRKGGVRKNSPSKKK